MERLICISFFSCLFLSARSQGSAHVSALGSGESLAGASVVLYSHGKISGLVANKDGNFFVPAIRSYDSIRISMVGYHSKTIFPDQFVGKDQLTIELAMAASELGEVVVKRSSALDIIRQTIAALSSFQPGANFENKGFYREIISDSQNFFSVAEAIFSTQYFPAKESYKLKLLQGRSKEDVAYTRLFEDFHPGGGPQSVAGKSFVVARPDFLNEKKLKLFTYKIDSLVKFDERTLYSISFDQKPGTKEALEKGRVLIDADSYAVIRYEAQNSPIGTPYIKDLIGSDKIFAQLLNIDFKRKGWKNRVDFTQVNNKWMMSYAESEYAISYKQPRKNVDLDLTINTELLFSELNKPIEHEISGDEEWKRKNMVANLPIAFDPAFWGDNRIISPTEEVKTIIQKISERNNDSSIATAIDDWQYLNRNLFVSYKANDTLTLIPVMRGSWEDGETAGMLYKEMEVDFIAESKISVVKNSDHDQMPDKGFQQAGVIVRSVNSEKENYILLTVGTGGNANPKFFLKRTIDNKSRTLVNKSDAMNGWLKVEKTRNSIAAFFKSDGAANFRKIAEYKLPWLTGKIQLGLVVFASFAGDGPKMKPDMKAIFSQLNIREP